MHQLDQLAREGGRYAAVHGGEKSFDSDETVAGSLDNYLQTVTTNKSAVLWKDIKDTIYVTPALASRVSGQPITVTITYSLKKKYILQNFPGMGFLSQTYNAKSTFVLE